MPLPGGPPPVTPGTPVPDSTNVLTVTPDPVTQSMLITVDMTGWNGTGGIGGATAATRVTVTRGDGTVVLGLDHIFAPGGITIGIDHDVPLGELVTYTAVLKYAATTWTTGSVSAELTVGPYEAWLKSLLTPALSRRVNVAQYPDFTYSIGQAIVQGDLNQYPSVGEGVRQASAGTLTLQVRNAVDLADLQVLLASPGPLFFQPSPASGDPDMYVHVGQLTRGRPFQVSSQPKRVWTLPLVEVARPFTDGSVVDLPGLTWADVPAGTTWAAMPSVAWVDLPAWMF